MAEQNKRKSENKNSQVKYSLHESRNVKTVAKRSAHSCLKGRILDTLIPQHYNLTLFISS